jgi:opacity protein-like surface antigen
MKKNNVLIFLFLLPLVAQSQDDLLKQLENETKATTEYATSTFKGTRLINGQTVETKGKGALEFIFAHRFGPINGGAYELFGLDQAYVRIGLEYGLLDNLGVGVGRNSVDKTMDAYLRYKMFRQSSGEKSMPFTITAFGIAAIKTSPKKEDATYDIHLEDRMSYTGQLLIARKINRNLSLQLMPSLVHKNTVDKTIENNDTWAVGVGGRLKVTRSVALTTEYYYRANVPDGNPYYNPLGFGVEIETGGHVFQLVMTNSRGLTERAYLTETAGDFFNGDIHLGFNITRTFQLRKNE